MGLMTRKALPHGLGRVPSKTNQELALDVVAAARALRAEHRLLSGVGRGEQTAAEERLFAALDRLDGPS